MILGLGNPGREYSETRHNLGRMCTEVLAARLGIQVDRRRWKSLAGSAEKDGRRVWIAWPQTYMNNSGEAAATALRDLGLGVDSLWLVYDEIDLPLCRLRIRVGGSAAGHNGVRSIMSHLRSHEFVRFRVGVGRPAADGVRHVLGRFSKREAESLPAIREGVADALEMALDKGLERAMEVFNQRGSLGCEDTA